MTLLTEKECDALFLFVKSETTGFVYHRVLTIEREMEALRAKLAQCQRALNEVGCEAMVKEGKI